MTSKNKSIVPRGRPERIIRFLGAVTPESACAAMEAILGYDQDGNDPIMLHLSSPGGCVSSGLALIDTMQLVKAPVFTVAAGMVASMGAIILAAGEPGYRYALPHTRIMLHPISGQSAGRLEEIQSAMRLHLELDREVEKILIERTKLPRKRLHHLLRQERFLSANEALELGLIDHIL